jgi:hypothetical protein
MVYYQPTPSQIYEDPPHERWRQRLVLMWWGFWLLAALVAAWLVYDYFYWSIRLPQDRVLTNKQGETMQVRIEGRAPGILKLTLLSDGSSHLYPTNNLVDADQEFVARLPIMLSFKYPLDYEMTDVAGRPVMARLEGRTKDLLKWTSRNDNLTHWTALDSLSAADQALALSLPATLQLSYPLEAEFTDKKGQPFGVSVEGRSDTVVKVTLAKDGTMQLMALAGLSPGDQEFLRNLPVNLTFNYPQDWTLTDQRGRSVHVSIEGRTPEVVKITVLEDGTTHLYPITNLSQKDQAFVQSLPVSLTLQYPLKSSLMDQQGHTLQVTIEGRSDEQVKFTREDDGNTYTYPITKLSDADQAYVRLLPLKWDESAAAAPAAPESIEIKNMRDRVTELRRQITDLNMQMTGSGVSQMQRDVLTDEMKIRQDEMDNLMTKLLNTSPANTADSDARSSTPSDLQQQIADIQQHIADVHTALAKGPPADTAASAYPKWRDQLNSELSGAEAQLSHLYDQAGSSSP